MASSSLQTIFSTTQISIHGASVVLCSWSFLLFLDFEIRDGKQNYIIYTAGYTNVLVERVVDSFIDGFLWY